MIWPLIGTTSPWATTKSLSRVAKFSSVHLENSLPGKDDAICKTLILLFCHVPADAFLVILLLNSEIRLSARPQCQFDHKRSGKQFKQDSGEQWIESQISACKGMELSPFSRLLDFVVFLQYG